RAHGGRVLHLQRSGNLGLVCGRLRNIEVELGPARALERPFVLAAPFESVAAPADREFYARLVHHPVVDALEPVIEEANLIAAAVLAVERMHVRAAMDAQLLVRRRRAHERL